MNRTTGLLILAGLSLVDIVDLAVTDGEHPPYSIALAAPRSGSHRSSSWPIAGVDAAGRSPPSWYSARSQR